MNNHLSLYRRMGVAAALALASLSGHAQSQTALANQPVFSTFAVPGNLALALSVEYPTAVSNAHVGDYVPASTYLGYFDPNKCYTYRPATAYFEPTRAASSHTCNGRRWSGNFLNWATMQTIDPFRWALTGGYRVEDTATSTVLEKAYASGQGNTGNFPDRTIEDRNIIAGATPLGWAGLKLRVQGLGANLRFTRNGNNYDESNVNALTAQSSDWNEDKVWQAVVRVKVCDKSSGLALESNCVAYDGGNYKPEGLIQKYSSKIRFSAFGYLNDSDINRDGGVLRAKQKFVGPTRPVPGSDPVSNSAVQEWNPSTGVMYRNPNKGDADDTANAWGITIEDSGVMNYLNKFGEVFPGSYKTYDPVGELYYAALRYLRNMPNVPQWTNPPGQSARQTQADGFPVITTWEDPIIYSCQKNFILGIGDVNTHADRNLPGSNGGRSEPSKPAAVNSDNAFDASIWTNKVGALSGVDPSLASQQPYNGCCTNNGALIAGMAYWANTTDISSKWPGKQTVKTYWLDVLEFQNYKSNNQFYLATRYGGANIPNNWDALGTSTDLPQSAWHSGSASDTVGGQLRPDTYYTAAKADQMVAGLSSAFASIVSSISAPTSSLNTASNAVSAGTESYASSYDSTGWTGEVEAFTVNALANPVTSTRAWKFSEKLTAQLGTDGLGWDTRRRVVTYLPGSGSTPGAGTIFRFNSLSPDQKTALNPTYTTASDAEDFVAYVRGSRKDEVPNSTHPYRVRGAGLVADIINSQVVVMGPPQIGILADAANPGYNAFATAAAQANRPNILIAGANSGLIHIINGSTTATDNNTELFAYIPSAAITGPSGTPSVDGIAATGNPDYEHRYLIDARPNVASVDIARTGRNPTTTGSWRSIAVGGMGKGGKSIWALNLTGVQNVDAQPVAAELAAAQRVMWEFKDPDLGFTFGTPVITKTAQYGWVVVVGSGHNNNRTGKGYFYILNAATGALLQKIALGDGDNGTESAPAGLSHLETYYRDRTDATVESIYAGDLHGNVWRLDLTATSGDYPAPVKLAKLTDAGGAELPITSAPTPVINSNGNRRWIVIGTGRLLSTEDLTVTRANRVYAIMDGFQARPAIATDLPTGVSLPFTDSGNRHDFQDISSTATAVDVTAKVGYVIDIPTATGNAAYQVINEADAIDNLAVIAAVRPTATDACSAGGTSKVMVIDLNTGVTTKITAAFTVDEVRFVKDGEDLQILVQGDPGDPTKQPPPDCLPGQNCCVGDCAIKTTGTGAGAGRLINWREIPLRN
ncbi:hypothetical protein CDL60_22370 [Roseateles noduli]|nr:hypothetical protein CDL60_22370 [Roseateles noduli]